MRRQEGLKPERHGLEIMLLDKGAGAANRSIQPQKENASHTVPGSAIRSSLSDVLITIAGAAMGGVLLGEAFFGPVGAVAGGFLGTAAAVAIPKKRKN